MSERNSCIYLTDRLHGEDEPATWAVTPADWPTIRVCDAHVVSVMSEHGKNLVSHITAGEDAST